MTRSPTASPGVSLVSGSGRGLGAEIAYGLAVSRSAVAVNDQPGSHGADRVVYDIRAAGGIADVFHADVTDEVAVAGLIADVEARLGPIDVLVVNATGPQPAISVDSSPGPICSISCSSSSRARHC